jgi:pyruvate kinase
MLPTHHTRIVATIGPASDSPDTLVRLIAAGVNITRLNFSHGSFEEHATRIERIRAAADLAGKPVAILADLPGPKMRLGMIAPEPIQLAADAPFTLTTEDITGDATRASTTFKELPAVVKPGDRLFLNDGLIHLKVEAVEGDAVRCRITVGGELSSRKGLNLPGIHLGKSAFTARDRDCLEFAVAHGVDAVSQSFVESADDLAAVREAAGRCGRQPFLIAKIERAGALENFESILDAADGIMVARGDLGVEVPVHEIGLIQKRLIARANLAGKPVITATQMLESMIHSRIPTRAEVTDVTNAILDGTDCVMLSAESAMGKFPVESVAMLAAIATATEASRPPVHLEGMRRACAAESLPEYTRRDAMAELVETALMKAPCPAVFVPTRGGSTARRIARFKPRAWIVAIAPTHATRQNLLFSAGVQPVSLDAEPTDWRAFAREWVGSRGLHGTHVMLVAGPSPQNPGANHRIEFLPLEDNPGEALELD